ncbi:hypothetical protein DSL64_12635 [Dyadobacter luteus]|uniref:Uncharacterized protein n=1 Tax=Dyadobacter luteus TaxID=2259619 RepID=A0A3D8YBB6_9BACT|nr:hypothetical protein [Dyadobacter luteus]REA61288.1 hypothetical protein DSL64_12635 [Dyadobacter luteus]
MKTRYLLPGSWRPYGIVLTLTSVLVSICWLISGEDFPLAQINTYSYFDIPDWQFSDNIFSTGKGGTVVLNITDEILGIGIICGLFITGFSKLKIEDERIALIRLESLQWGIYVNFTVMVVCIIFVYDTWFLLVMIYNMFTPLFIFVARFYWLLYVSPAIEAKKERSLV